MSIFTFVQILLTLGILSAVHAEVQPPNYNFKLEEITRFYPGKIIDQNNQQFSEFNKNGKYTILKGKHKAIRYHFDLFVQVEKDSRKIVDLFVRLPSYFLHDVFHQSLINRYGKQDLYKKIENNAIYYWKKSRDEGLRITYAGSCTITCFPIYLHVSSAEYEEKEKSFKSLLKNFNSDTLIFQ